MKKRLHVICHGKVQGVNFRWVTYERALQLNLSGWVKNRADRKVEAIFEGEDDDLAKMLEFLQDGPPAASVRNVDTRWSPATGDFTDFTIDY